MARRGGIGAPVTIRAYRDGDRDAVIALARELQTHESGYYDRMKPPQDIGDWYVERLHRDVTDHKGAFLIAEVDGAAVGYATLLTEVSSAEEREEVLYTYSHVGDLAMAEPHRGRGIGRALLAECERIAGAAGQKWLRLGVLAGNTSARDFYRRIGLEEAFLTLEKKLS